MAVPASTPGVKRTTVAAAATARTPAQTVRRQPLSQDTSPYGPDDDDEDSLQSVSGPSSAGPLSPSADARRRLEAARAKMGVATVHNNEQQQQNIFAGDDALDGDEDEDLANMSLEQTSRPIPPSTSMSSMELNSLRREVEELRVKNRLAEKRREEERARVKELEKWQEDNDEKLRTAASATEKLHAMDAQLLSLQTSEKELNLLKADLEERVEDLTEQLEMAALDREVAEEKADAATAELDQLKQMTEELKLEVDVLREENALYESGPVDESERSSTGWIQLEKQNERLKEALIRLRDVTSETEHEQRRRISDLEKELSALADVQDARDTLTSKLQASEAQLEDVKIQLDDALGAEEMLEQLTERNLFLGERMAEMSGTIEELESLKELNEELEEIHNETEKQMQEEIDLKDMTLRERQRRVESLEATLNEYEGTFSQFRELVLNLQSDNEALRTEREGLVADSQNASLNTQSREMLNLNLKLQSSALKSQARTIDVELGKMKAEQSALQLEMQAPYLSTHFTEQGDKDAVDGLLFFKRMSGKSDLIRSIIESNREVSQVLSSLAKSDGETEETQQDANGQQQISSLVQVPDHLIGVCQLRHSLAHFSAVCSSTAAMLRQSPPGTFLKCGRMYKEMQAAVESRVDAFVEALRKEELKEEDCNAEFKRFVRQFEELNYALMVSQEEEMQASVEDKISSAAGADGDLAAKEVGSAMLLDLDLDTLTASLFSARQVVGALYTGAGSSAIEWQLNGQSLESRYFSPLQQLLTDIRAAKVLARKLQRRLSNLASNDEAVSMSAIGDLPSLGRMSSKMVTFATSLSASVATYVNEVRNNDGGSNVFAIQSLLDAVREAARELVERNADGEISTPSTLNADPWALAISTSEHLAKTISGLVSAATEQDNVVGILAAPSPWHPRSTAVHTLASHNAEMERSVLKLQDDLRDLYHQIKARDAALSESAIKMERLQKSLERSKNADAEQENVRVKLNEVKAQARAYQDANEALQAELDAAEKNNEELKSRVTASAATATDASGLNGGAGAAGASGNSAAMDMQTASGFASAANAILHGSRGSGSSTTSASLETHYLLDQLDAMRSVIKYLREENALLLYNSNATVRAESDALSLTPLVHRGRRADATSSDTETDDAAVSSLFLRGLPHQARRPEDVPRREDLRTIQGEQRALFDSLLSLAATPKLVTLAPPASSVAGGDASATAATATTSASHHHRQWQREAQRPAGQYDAQISTIESMMRRFEKLQARRSGAGVLARSSKQQQRLKQIQMPILRSVVPAT